MRVVATLALFTVCLLLAPSALAQSGKIAGRVTDAVTSEPLPGVNVLITGTTQGTSTDLDGYYTILNVGPGQYDVRYSFLGYTTQVVDDVDVNIDQTTTINVALQDETVGLDEVVVRAERPVVQPDVSNSQLNVSAEEIEGLPVASVEAVVNLQAGIQDGFTIRGSGADQVSFRVNGLTLRDERNNAPFTNISLASIQEIQAQTGGFNAEYGNVRSGVVNVVTKEGSRDSYDAEAILRYSPPTQKHFGMLANDLNSYWIRPYVDPDVAFTGTESGAWDAATQAQYPSFEGWISISEGLLADDDPTNDLTPEALQQAFLWQHRKGFEIVEPDYDVDVGFGGPVPFVSSNLGVLRFYASYRREQNMYMIPLNTSRYLEQTGHLKVTSDLGTGMKLSLEGRLGEATGTAASRAGQPGIFRSASGIASGMSRVSFIDTRIFSTDYWAPTQVRSNQIGATFTHLLNPSTFYEVRFNRFASLYDTSPGPLRDTSCVTMFGGVCFDAAPFGFEPRPTFGVEGMRTGVGMSNARDTSRVANYNLKADLTSQINPFLEVKTGLEYNVTDSRVNYGSFDAFLPSNNSTSVWDRSPVRGAAYGQTKLEFQGLIANAGLRLDYFHAGGDWFDFQPFEQAFVSEEALDTLAQVPTDRILTLSPRIGVSFPVTATSKLYFNYGHFRSLPDPNNLYLVEILTQTGRINQIADPNSPLPRTIAYELGYEQSFLDQFLVKVAGYYKDVTFQPQSVTYVSRNGQVEYDVNEPNNYEDIRGIEFTLSRRQGWLQGFFNYTYMVFTNGFFRFGNQFENPALERDEAASTARARQLAARPRPRPYGRLNVDILSPEGFGPEIAGTHPLQGWRVSFLGSWSDGGEFNWPNGTDVLYQRPDFWNADLRFAKTFEVAGRGVTFFADINNLFNTRRLSFSGFVDGADQNAYLSSLHLPEDSENTINIPGSDRIGDFRDDDITYVPMQRIESREEVTFTPDPDAIYFEFGTGSYLQYEGDTWVPANMELVNQVLDTKAYIDMPNQGFLTFLNPRNVYFGLRLTF